VGGVTDLAVEHDHVRAGGKSRDGGAEGVLVATFSPSAKLGQVIGAPGAG